jgi:hypothetical protein
MDENLRFETGEEPKFKPFKIFQIVWVLGRKMQWFWDCRKFPRQEKYVSRYRATRTKDTTRARANALREYLTHSERK